MARSMAEAASSASRLNAAAAPATEFVQSGWRYFYLDIGCRAARRFIQTKTLLVQVAEGNIPIEPVIIAHSSDRMRQTGWSTARRQTVMDL